MKSKIVSEIKVTVKNSDGSNTQTTSIMPYEVSEEILCFVVDWKNRCGASVKDIEEYQKAEKEFINTLKDN